MPHPLARHWRLDPRIAFLNHGSFGACPTAVLEAQAELRDELEREPVEFFVRRLPTRFDAARVELARFLGADEAGLVAVPNATAGVNAVLRSLRFERGDELLRTDHGYNACGNVLDFVARRDGARVVVARVPFPLGGPDEVHDAVLRAVTPRTRLALLDHVTSPTALIFPVERLVPALVARGVEVLIDGAHAPGMLPVDLRTLGATYYTGNCHKWLCAPKGAGFLWVAPGRREAIRPLAISHGANTPRPGRSRFHDEFDWTGTDDPTPFLCVPVAIRFLASLVDGGWSEIRRRNHDLAVDARRTLLETLGGREPCPEAMLGSMAALPIRDGDAGPPDSALYTDPLQERLVREHGIEVPLIPWPAPPQRLLRVSAQLYNSIDPYDRLASVLGTVDAGPRA